jgi:diguanylate cyclase (GGDEF)-like protein
MDNSQEESRMQADAPRAAQAPLPAEQRDGLKLLIVEDDRDQYELMRETLEDHFGAGVVTWAASRREALARNPAGFSLILCDYNLPDGSGLDLLEEIVGRCKTPVLMVTGENIGQIAAEAVQRGATDYVVKIGEYLFTLPLVVEKNLTLAKIKRENESLRVELERALAALREKNHQLQESLGRVEELAATDPLTGMYNRRHFSQLLDQLFAEAQRYEKDLSCVMIDLDGYKQLNDTYGHQVGDQLLVLAGRVIKTNLRRMDVAARYGGDEFVLLLPHAAAAEAAEVVRRIREEYHTASALLLKRNAGVGVSGGIASLANQRPPHSDQLVAMADTALYRAKEEGRNRTHLATGTVPRAA